MTHQCDFIHNGVIECTEDAAWMIEVGFGEKRMACTKHVGDLLVPGKHHQVISLGKLEITKNTRVPSKAK